jgi:hypothetical protein
VACTGNPEKIHQSKHCYSSEYQGNEKDLDKNIDHLCTVQRDIGEACRTVLPPRVSDDIPSAPDYRRNHPNTLYLSHSDTYHLFSVLESEKVWESLADFVADELGDW